MTVWTPQIEFSAFPLSPDPAVQLLGILTQVFCLALTAPFFTPRPTQAHVHVHTCTHLHMLVLTPTHPFSSWNSPLTQLKRQVIFSLPLWARPSVSAPVLTPQCLSARKDPIGSCLSLRT